MEHLSPAWQARTACDQEVSGKLDRATMQLQEGPMPCCFAHLAHLTCSQPNEQYWWQLIQAGGTACARTAFPICPRLSQDPRVCSALTRAINVAFSSSTQVPLEA